MSDRKLGYAIIFLFLTVSVVILAYCIKPLLSPPRTRVIAFERIGNLRLDDQVRVKGMSYGTVNRIDWTRKNVYVKIQGSTPLTVHAGYSVVTMDAGIMGDRMVMIDNGPENAPVVPRDDTLSGDFVPGVSEAVGYAWKLQDVVDSLRDLSYLLLHGDSRHKSVVSQTKGVIVTIDSVSKSVLRFARVAENVVTSGIDSLDHFVNQTTTLSRAVKSSGPAYLTAISQRLAGLDRMVSSIDSTTTMLMAVSANLSREDNILWKDDIKKLSADLVTVQQAINGIQKELLKFKTYLRLW